MLLAVYRCKEIPALTIYFIIAYAMLVVLVCLHIILHNSTPSKGLAYILLAITVPALGILFYLSVGLNYRKAKLYRKKLQIDDTAYPELRSRNSLYIQTVLKKHENSLGHYFQLANLLKSENRISDDNEVTLLINGEEKFPLVIEDLKKAQHHIHIEYYIYEDDRIGRQIAEILMEKARAGVYVRFIYDDFGSSAIRKKMVEQLREAGVEAFPFYKINLIQFANRINYRNHRKIIVIDGITGYIGGINVSDNYINPSPSNLYWRDTHLKITGSAALNLQFVFLTDWNFCADQNIGFSKEYFPMELVRKAKGNQLVQILSSGPDSDYPTTMYSLMQIILLARKELRITTPYFIPDKSFFDAIKIAALSGVSVQLLVPGVADSYIVNTTSQSYYQELLTAGVKIYRYKRGFVHAKTLVCDNQIAVVGTVNLDNRSFDLNFEINAVVYNEGIATRLSEQFDTDLGFAEALDLASWKKRPLYQRLIEKTLHLFSPLM